MIRLFVPHPLSAGAGVAPSLDQSRYLIAVMRLSVGDEILVFNGQHGEWRCSLTEAGKRGCLLRAEEQTREQDHAPDLDLVVAMVKRGRVETIVEKAAELGARRVRLTQTRRTNVDFLKLGRLDAIAIEAAEQTGRLDVPVIDDPMKLDKILDSWDPARKLVFWEGGGTAGPRLGARPGRPAPAAIRFGPEGGFAPEGRERLRALPFVIPVSLGPRILRADTAAIAAMTLWQAVAGDWRGG